MQISTLHIQSLPCGSACTRDFHHLAYFSLFGMRNGVQRMPGARGTALRTGHYTCGEAVDLWPPALP